MTETHVRIERHLKENYSSGYSEMDNPEIRTSWSRWCAEDGRNLFAVEHNLEFFGQAAQDLFVLYCLKKKSNGHFLEIGSNDPIFINNSFLLELKYGWKGIMIEYLESFLPSYELVRPASHHIIGDALSVPYASIIENCNGGADFDYLQIDLDWFGSLKCLELLNKRVLAKTKFAVVTYEHDHKNIESRFSNKIESRKIFLDRGYLPIFLDVKDVAQRPYEDWYIHPDLVDINHVSSIQNDTPLTWKEIVVRIKNTMS